ncbi:MAG: biotin/lipoyl-containing protein [Acidobacteriota bacterium]
MDLIARLGDREAKIRLERGDDGGYLVVVDDSTYEVDVANASSSMSLRVADGRQFEVGVRRLKSNASSTYRVTSLRGVDTVEIMDPLTHMLEQTQGPSADAGRAEALMPGRVVEILVGEGDEVERGQGVVVLEAMKMKNEIHAETAGTVKRLFVSEGQNVEGGDPLFEIG